MAPAGAACIQIVFVVLLLPISLAVATPMIGTGSTLVGVQRRRSLDGDAARP